MFPAFCGRAHLLDQSLPSQESPTQSREPRFEEFSLCQLLSTTFLTDSAHRLAFAARNFG
jgi:hypothetical protein